MISLLTLCNNFEMRLNIQILYQTLKNNSTFIICFFVKAVTDDKIGDKNCRCMGFDHLIDEATDVHLV